MTTLPTTWIPSLPAAARGWRARAGALLRSVWDVLETAGRMRAAAELRRTAALYAHTDPDLAARLRAAAGVDGPPAPKR